MEKALGDWIASCFSGMKRACALSSTSRLPTAPPYRAPIGSMPQPRVGHRPASNPNMHDPTGFQRPNPWHTSLEGEAPGLMSCILLLAAPQRAVTQEGRRLCTSQQLCLPSQA